MKPFAEDVVWFMDKLGINPLNFNKIKGAIFILLTAPYVYPPIMYLLFKRGTYFLETLAITFTLFLTIFKLYFLTFCNKRIAKLLLKTEDFWSLTTFGDEVKQKLSSVYNGARITTLLIQVFYGAAIILFTGRTAFTRSLIVPFYLFSLDVEESHNFEIIFAYQVFGTVLTTSGVIAFDMLFICLVYNVLSQFRLIKGGLEYLSVNPNKPGDDERCLMELKILVEHHSKILKFVRDFDSCYRTLLLLHFLFSSLGISCIFLAITVSGGTSNLVETATYVLVLIDLTSEMFCYCFAGSLIADESDSVAYAIYQTKWWVKTQPRLRKGLTLAILRSQRTAKLTAGGLVDLNLEGFTDIVKRGYSFFAVIRTFYSKQEN